MKNNKFISLFGLVMIGLSSIACKSQAAELKVTQNANGPTGLVLMPSARMHNDGEFSLHYSQNYPYSQYVISAQPLPWLQALFKYTDIATRPYQASTTGQSLKDKSTDIKVTLFDESYFLPEVALGINDVGGTGLFSAEYLVASKQVKNMDFTLGLGWGYLGKKGHFSNPFTYLSDSFKTRERTGKVGGEFNTLSFFAGEKVALFGGAEYHFEDWPVVAKIEYDANNYVNDPGGTLKQSLPVNMGLVYSPNKHIDLHAGMVRGDALFLGLSMHMNLKSNGPVKFLDPEPEIVNESTEGIDNSQWQQVVAKIQATSGLDVDEIYQKDNQLVIEAQPKMFHETAKGIGRAARVLINQEALKNTEKFTFTEKQYGNEVLSVSLDKQTFSRAAKLEIPVGKVLHNSKILPAADSQDGNGDLSKNVLYSANKRNFDYQVVPFFKGSYGGPDAFVLYQLGINANANYFVRDNSWLSGTMQLGLADNYDIFNYEGVPSKLPHVRTDIKDYLKTSALRLSNLQLNDFEKLGKNWFALGYVGYLESMYAGIGSEVMYRPVGNWAIAADLNYVKKREFDQRFAMRDYSVTTGHLTGYYETDDHMLFKLSAGRYLAKDVGITIDMSKKFRSGARLGFWATRTNVSPEDFGEGSFDKGFYMSFPMNLFTFKSTKSTSSLRWQFLTRDGGQKLRKKYELYDITDARSEGFLRDSFEYLLH